MAVPRSTTVTVLVALVGLTGIAVSTMESVARSEAQWADDASFATGVTTGTWRSSTTLGACEVVDAGGEPVSGEPCRVSAITLVEQGGTDAGSLLREYELEVIAAPSDPSDRVRFEVDLASPEVTSLPAVPNAAWTWSDASSTTSTRYMTARDFLCSSLPVLEGSAAAPVTSPILIDVRDHPTGAQNCAS